MNVAFNKIKLTPKEYIGKPLAGYSRKDPCLGKLDDIYANGVLINKINNDGVILLISVDTLKLPLSLVEYIKKKLTSKFNSLKEDTIIIHATHTHSSFDLTGEFYYQGGFLGFIKGVMFADNKNDRYIIWMVKRIVKMVDTLFKELEPCKIAWKKKKFNPDLVLNRRWPTRTVSPDLVVIAFRKLRDNDLIGLIINYSCHPTTLSFENNKLSADYPGRVIYRIEASSYEKVKSIYFNGPSGDLNPITTSGTDLEKIAGDLTLSYDQHGTYEHTKKIGYIIGEEALKFAKLIPDENYFTEMDLESHTKRFLIPQKDAKYFSKVWFLNSVKWWLKKFFLFKIAKFDKNSVNFPFFTVERKNLRIYAETVVKYIKFTTSDGNNYGLITVPGELFEDIGKNILHAAPISQENVIIIQNAQDWIGYLFPLKVYITEGGYEPFMCFSPLCGFYVENNIKQLLKEAS